MQSSGSSGKTVWVSVAALCCLGIIVFLLAATIVLALIPVYLPKKSVTTTSGSNNKFYLQYTAIAGRGSSVTGNVTNLDTVAKTLGITKSALILSGAAQANFVRRRRHAYLGSRRQKRELVTNFLFICVYVYPKTCKNDNCRASVQSEVTKKTTTNGTIPSIEFNIKSKGVSKSHKLSLLFVSLIAAKPIGFNGEATSFTFVATKSGAFNHPLTWADGIVPYDSFSVAITLGVTVSLPHSSLPVQMTKCQAHGGLTLGGGKKNFAFEYSTALVVRSGGVIQDSTSEKLLIMPAGSFIMVLKGGYLDAVGTTIKLQDSGSGQSIVISSGSGPRTCGFLSDGSLIDVAGLVFFAVQSGGFKSESTYLGGLVPSSELCSEDGCSIEIQSGVTLSTDDLDGVLDIKINEIKVAAGASLELGTRGSSKGFKFLHPIKLKIYGTLSFVASGGGIFLPASSNFLVYGGGSFKSLFVAAYIQIYDVISGAFIGSRMDLGFGYSGPYFIIISASGKIRITISEKEIDEYYTTTVASYTSGYLG